MKKLITLLLILLAITMLGGCQAEEKSEETMVYQKIKTEQTFEKHLAYLECI